MTKICNLNLSVYNRSIIMCNRNVNTLKYKQVSIETHDNHHFT